MEQENQNQSEYSGGQPQKKGRQAKEKREKNGELKIIFHNPNTEEDTAKFLSEIILNSLEELGWDNAKETES